jgi:hypothetical protein
MPSGTSCTPSSVMTKTWWNIQGVSRQRKTFGSAAGSKLNIDKMAKEDEEWDETNATNERADARLMVLMYLENVDQNKYGTVLKGLMDQFLLDQDQYPKTINHATSVLSNHKFDEKYFE